MAGWGGDEGTHMSQSGRRRTRSGHVAGDTGACWGAEMTMASISCRISVGRLNKDVILRAMSSTETRNGAVMSA